MKTLKNRYSQHFETPDALRRDVITLSNDAEALLEATKANAELLHELAQGHQDVIRLVMELERRSREQEEAIRVVLRKGGAH